MSNGPPRVGLFPPFGLPERGREAARSFLAGVAEAGLDHVCCADHVSFVGGLGFDGLIRATALARLHPSLPVYTGLYLLPMRHPVLVAPRLADLGQLAPGPAHLRRRDRRRGPPRGADLRRRPGQPRSPDERVARRPGRAGPARDAGLVRHRRVA